MTIHEKLEKWMADGRPIGFSPWRDAEAVLWGRVTRVAVQGFCVEQISPLGQKEAEEPISFSSVSYFDDDAKYSERLIRLEGFNPTKPIDLAFVRVRPAVRSMLSEAVQTGEIIRVKLRSELGSRTVRILSCGEDWAEFANFDDLMVEEGRMIWRISCVLGVRWRSAYEEADEFLLASGIR